MSLGLSRFASQNANAIGLPNKGDVKQKTTTKKPAAKRVSAEQRAEEARLNDPYGNAGRTGQTGRRTRVVRRRVRRRRVGGQTQARYGQTKAQQKAQVKTQGPQAQNFTQGANHNPNAHMERSLAQSNLNQFTSQWQNSKSGQNRGPQTPVGKKMAMLGNLKQYMKNDYSCMKANENDKAFTYRTSEARQLCATLGTMVASATKQGKGKDSGKSDSKKPLSPKQFAAQKGLLKRLKMMSDPTGPMPEGLPPDYQPFESVA